MGSSKRPPVQAYHDRVAPRYDHSYTDGFWQWHDALTWDYLKPFLPTEQAGKIVDLGCGTGTWAAKLMKSGYDVTCVDISHRMLDQARRKVEQQAGLARAQFVQADLCDLSTLPPRAFSLAIALGDPIGCTDAPARALKQIRRILRPDGILVATFDNRLAAIDYYLDKGDPVSLARFLKDGKTHWLTKDAGERFPIVTVTPTCVRKLLEAGGFSVLDLIGKTVLPMRHHRELLCSPEERRRWARIEKSLCRDPAAMGRASHLQVVGRAVRP